MSIEQNAKYTRIFIAIMLPNEHLTDFNQLFYKAKNILGDGYKLGYFASPHPSPHLTLMFLANKAIRDLTRIRSTVKQGAGIISGETLEVGGFGTFLGSDGKPAAIYLPVAHSDNLSNFQKYLVTELDDLSHPTIKRPFIPHFTTLKIPYGETRSEILRKERPLREALGAVSLRFQATQVDIVASKSQQGHKPKTSSIDTIVIKNP